MADEVSLLAGNVVLLRVRDPEPPRAGDRSSLSTADGGTSIPDASRNARQEDLTASIYLPDSGSGGVSTEDIMRGD